MPEDGPSAAAGLLLRVCPGLVSKLGNLFCLSTPCISELLTVVDFDDHGSGPDCAGSKDGAMA